MVAKVQCLGPISADQHQSTPITVRADHWSDHAGATVQPITGPITPIQPIQPITGPIRPVTPVQPIQPGPITPIQPIRPIAPIVNPGPIQPAAGESPESTGERGSGAAQRGLSAEDVQTLSDLIIKSEIDLG